MADKKTLFILIFIAGCFWLTAKYNRSQKSKANSPSVVIVENDSSSEVTRSALFDAQAPQFDTNMLLVTDQSDSITSKPQAPEVISESDQATLITKEDVKKSLLKELILRELPNSTPDEVQILLEEYGDLEPEMALGILQLHKNLGSTLPDFLNSSSTLTPQKDSAEIDVETPLVDLTEEPQLFSPEETPVDLSAPELETLKRIWKAAQAVCFHNLERMDCPGYKQVELNPYFTLSNAFTANAQIRFTPENSQMDVRQGEVYPTGKQLDFAIEGKGWLVLSDDSGNTLYTRNGRFHTNENGDIVQKAGNTEFRLEPAINLPADCTDLQLLHDGTLMYIPGDATSSVAAGKLQISYFSNPKGLSQTEFGHYQQTEKSGEAIVAEPGTAGTGTVLQGCLERSNVDREQTLELLRQHKRQWEAGIEAAAISQSARTR